MINRISRPQFHLWLTEKEFGNIELSRLLNQVFEIPPHLQPEDY